MNIIENLSTIKGKKGLFTIVLSSILLTLFEIIFFYNIIASEVINEIDENIKNAGIVIAREINVKNKELQQQSLIMDIAVSQISKLLFNDTTDRVLNTLAIREKRLIDSINTYTIYTGVVILIFLLILLYILWNSIKYNLIKCDDYGINHERIYTDVDMTDSAITAFMTVGIIIIFQILFYFYGKKYKYPGSAGNNEIINVVINGINNNNSNQK